MNTLPRPHPLVIAILDGWGINFETEGNAIVAAKTPTMDLLAAHYPIASLAAAGLEVGLPIEVAGNSETGHRNIGAGRVEYQILASIDHAIEEGSFFENEVFLNAIRHAQRYNSKLHLMGLLSGAGIHSHIDHLSALLKLAADNDFKERVYVHLFADGRDAPPQSVRYYVKSLEEAMGKYGLGTIASIAGRFYAMDRNQNWQRTEKMYQMLVGGKRPPGASSLDYAITRSYAQNVFDEKIPPTALTRGGAPVASIEDTDAVIFFNFRPDRARQLTQAFTDPDQVGFKAQKFKNLYFASMTAYGPDLEAQTAFKEDIAEYPLARVVAEAGLTQLHVAETEKYAHITYYLNVGREKPFKGEERLLVRSSRTRDFAKEPAMEAQALTDRVLQKMKAAAYDIYFINFANADMVGHTGDLQAATLACEVVDRCLGQLLQEALAAGGALLVTADHGNAEQMINPATGDIDPEHTRSPVPFFYARRELKRSVGRSSRQVQDTLNTPIGVLADVAPTVLDVLRLEKPSTMTGISLLGSLQ